MSEAGSHWGLCVVSAGDTLRGMGHFLSSLHCLPRLPLLSASVVVAPAVGGLDPVFVCWGCHNKHHGLGALTKESHFLPVLVAASPGARCWQGRLLLGLQTAVFSLRLHATILCVCLLTPLLIKPPISGLGATFVTSFQLHHPFKDPVSKVVTF